MARPMGSSVPPVDRIVVHSDETIEERCFIGALICLEGHYSNSPPMGPMTASKVTVMVSKTLEKTHAFKEVREALSKNVAIWLYLTKIFASAVPVLTDLTVTPLADMADPDQGVGPNDSSSLILKNYAVVKADLQVLNKLMHIARNLLVTSEPEVPQDICAAVHFDQVLYQTIVLCVNVTSKGFDGEVLDEGSRARLNEISELFKKIMVTSLQQAHNWTAKNDRNKMSFWCDVLFDDDATADDDETGFSIETAKTEVQNWIDRNALMCPKARELLKAYANNQSHRPPGALPIIAPLAWNWLPEGVDRFGVIASPTNADGTAYESVWLEDEPKKFNQDRDYGRVSHEIDTWWLKARDENYSEWKVPMPSVEFAQRRADSCKGGLLHHYAPYREGDFEDDGLGEPSDGEGDESGEVDGNGLGVSSIRGGGDGGNGRHAAGDSRSLVQGYVDDLDDDEDDEDDDPDDVDDAESYGDGPMTGLLTEIPNILDPKQIEALHMIVKSCIVDTAVSATSPQLENLQQTRCRLFIALECGKSLLREMLVFIAVWEKDEQSLIFQITTQIVEALHQNALLPYTWRALRIPKDITSPAQTVLLRLIGHMYRTQQDKSTGNSSASTAGSQPAGSQTAGPQAVPVLPSLSNSGSDNGTASPSPSVVAPADPAALKMAAEGRVRLLHFLFSNFRSRIVPECLALMVIQAHIREGDMDPADFPVDNWDMERAKDGLAQFLDFLLTAAEDFEMRTKLIEWDATYELVTLLRNLERAVKKKAFTESHPAPAAPAPHNNNGAAPPPQQPSSSSSAAAAAASPRPAPAAASSGAVAVAPHPAPPPPSSLPVLSDQPSNMQELAWKYPWPEVKCQVLAMLACLLQPAPGRTRPGNEIVQRRVVQYNGMAALLNSSLYDEHNPYARERVQLCLKWLLDGGVEANQFVNDLVRVKAAEEVEHQQIRERQYYAQQQQQRKQQQPVEDSGGGSGTLRIDGFGGPVNVRSGGPRPTTAAAAADAAGAVAGPSATAGASSPATATTTDLPVRSAAGSRQQQQGQKSKGT